jgi:CubicO group peptidase (beta-lactamase class C family)
MIDEIMSSYDSPEAPGASVLVMKGDSILFSKGYGSADLRTGETIKHTTNFRLASITKQFTAMSVLMLSESGKLSLDDKLHKFFPDFPAYGRDIRIRNLLTHTSGLMDYEDLIPENMTLQLHDRDCLNLMSRTDSLYFASGTRYRYSNTGYAILALITEKVSGQRFSDFLKDSIFNPLGMKTTVAFEDGRSVVPNRAYGHNDNDGEWTHADQSQTSAVLGDGGIYSNSIDLATWISSLWESKLIQAGMQKEAWTMARLNDGTAIDYGYGWHLDTANGRNDPHHDGSTKGFRNHILLYPDRKMMVVVLTNRNEGEPRALAKKIAALYKED